ncbi:Werner syndrome-like exonuclease, partial [Prunus dulcis]
SGRRKALKLLHETITKKSQSLENKSRSKKTILSESELDDEPFTEEDLQAIEAAFEAATSSSLPKKRRSSPDDDSDGDDKTQQHHCRIARRRLPSSVLALQHPNAFSLSLVVKFGGQITYSRTAVQVEKAAMEVLNIIEAKEKEAGQTAVGFDIEWRPTFQRGVPPRKAAVMQICVDTSCCHVMHIVHSGIPQSWTSIAGDSVKVFKDYNVSTKAVEDLKYLAKRKLGGGLQNWGLASLTEKLICKQLLKPNKIRLGNWEAKFLSKEQLEYAAIDAFTSWHLYEVLKSLPDAEKVTPDNQSEELQAVSS